MLKMLQGKIVFGASGAVASAAGAGIASVTKLATGIYQILFVEDYQAYIGSDFSIQSGVSGGAVADGSFVTGTLYQIVSVGTTNYLAVGYPAGMIPVVGGVFVATGAGGAGTGTVKAIAPSGVMSVEVAGNAQTQLGSSLAATGGQLIIQTLNTSDALASPASGCEIDFMLYFRDSSVSL